MVDPKKVDFFDFSSMAGKPNPGAEREETSGERLVVPLPPNTVYPGRPNWCGGAYIPNSTGQMRRWKCLDAALPGQALCQSCSDREREMRDELRMKAQVAQEPAQDATKRNRWTR